MASPFRPEGAVSPADIRALLAAVAQRTSDPNAGIFGPGSASWKINRESALFLGAGRAALLQLAHPWVATALAHHSSLMERPIARFHNTFRIVFTLIFGSLPQALGAARHLYKLHTRIGGQLPQDVARYARGSRYEANEIGALLWVYATLIDSAIMAHECALGPLLPTELDRYYDESKILAGLFGLPMSALPETWQAFVDYNRAMHSSDALGVSDGAREMAHRLLAGSGSWIHSPVWYRGITAAWMPERFRAEFRLPYGPADRDAAAGARLRIPQIYRRLPPSLRFVGPWHEAQARIAGHGPGPLAQLSNRFWIGQFRLPFSDGE